MRRSIGTMNPDKREDAMVAARLMRANGKSLRSIGEMLGVSRSTVDYWCKREPIISETAIPNPSLIAERTTVLDTAGNPLSLVNTEGDFIRAYGKDLIRKTRGCDFRDPNTQELIEVKSFAVNPAQCLEIVQEYFKDKRRAILATVQGNIILIFRLENILKVPEPENDPV